MSVMEYDGAFRCLECGAQWGAISGPKAQAGPCEHAPRVPLYRPDRLRDPRMDRRRRMLRALLNDPALIDEARRILGVDASAKEGHE